MLFDPERSAFLVVDVQNDFCPGGALAVPDGDAVVEPINRLSRHFRTFVLTQDWHPEGHVSFASTWRQSPHDTIVVDGRPQVLWPDHCVQGSPGAAFHPGLEADGATLVLRKGTRKGLDSYSALFENDRMTPTGLEGLLSCLGVRNLWIAGLATDYCVYYSALDAMRCGFDVFIVEDGVRGVDVPAGNVARVLSDLEGRGARFVGSRALDGASGTSGASAAGLSRAGSAD